MALKDVRASGGCGVLVSEEAILDAIRARRRDRRLRRAAAAIALAGLELALAEEEGLARGARRPPRHRHGPEGRPAASRRVRVPEPVEPTMEAVEALFG
jgi:hypothetical protein